MKIGLVTEKSELKVGRVVLKLKFVQLKLTNILTVQKIREAKYLSS